HGRVRAHRRSHAPYGRGRHDSCILRLIENEAAPASAVRTQEDESAMGKVYLIGAGPGAADLITVRGARLLGTADVVLHDALVEPAMLDYAPHARKIAVGKRCGQRSTAQHFINKQ